ncbi:MAG: 5'-nucleotidase [Raineya sp.]
MPKTYVLQSADVSFVEANAQLAEDTAVLQTIAPYKSQLDAQMNKVIGYAAKEILNGRKQNETLLGNLVADMAYQRATKESKQSIDLAFVTFGGLRTSIPAGEIKVSDIFELMPFENELVLLEVNADIVKQLFDYLAFTKNIAISNSKVLIENDKVKDVLINGEPIDPNKIYRIVTSDYLAYGGDSMSFLAKARKMDFLNVKFRDMIIEAIVQENKAGRKIDANIGGRVEVR